MTCRENDITDVIDETFTTMEERFGEMVTIELKPGGTEVPVTEENKKEYVDHVVEYRISKRVKDQFDAFMSGFSELIPQDLINVFDERELELLIGGMSEIDVYVFPFLFRLPILWLKTSVGMTGQSSRTIGGTKSMMRLSSGSGNACARGRRSASHAYYSSQREHHAFLSMASRIYKALTGHGALQSKRLATRTSCRRVTHALIVLTCHRIRITQAWNTS
jgi:HECT-domain (ubiquitin-transferase)